MLSLITPMISKSIRQQLKKIFYCLKKVDAIFYLFHLRMKFTPMLLQKINILSWDTWKKFWKENSVPVISRVFALLWKNCLTWFSLTFYFSVRKITNNAWL